MLIMLEMSQEYLTHKLHGINTPLHIHKFVGTKGTLTSSK